MLRAFRSKAWTTVAVIFILLGQDASYFAVADERLPIPDDASLAAGSTLVVGVFGDDIAKAKTPEEKLALAQKLLAAAGDSTIDSRGRFALLEAARNQAVEAKDPDTSLAAIDAMASSYAIDSLAMKLEALSVLGRSSTTVHQRANLVEQIESVTDEAISADRYDIAKQMGNLQLRIARQARDSDLSARTAARINNTKEAKAAYDTAVAALKVLETNPNDAQANLTVGRFYCFSKGDWDRGLPMLALGGDLTLKALAESELKGASGGAVQMALADAWWEQSEKTTGVAKQQIAFRAAKWYRAALPQVTGLDKAKVERRLHVVENAPQARRPVSLPEGPNTGFGGMKFNTPYKIENGVLFLDGPMATGSIGVSSNSYKKFDVAVDIMTVGDWQHAGIRLGLVEEPFNGVRIGRNALLVRLFQGGKISDKTYTLSVVENEKVVSSVQLSKGPNAWVRLRVIAEGQTVRVWTDGRQVAQTQSKTYAGPFALYVGGGAKAYFRKLAYR